jgi:hypothetical protein
VQGEGGRGTWSGSARSVGWAVWGARGWVVRGRSGGRRGGARGEGARG